MQKVFKWLKKETVFRFYTIPTKNDEVELVLEIGWIWIMILFIPRIIQLVPFLIEVIILNSLIAVLLIIKSVMLFISIINLISNHF